MVRTVLVSITLILGLTACGSAEVETDPTSTTQETMRLRIGPDLVDCEGVAPQSCMLVSDSEDGEPEFFYDEIDGFRHEAGTSYVIDVTITEVEDPPADGSSLAYTLVEVVSES